MAEFELDLDGPSGLSPTVATTTTSSTTSSNGAALERQLDSLMTATTVEDLAKKKTGTVKTMKESQLRELIRQSMASVLESVSADLSAASRDALQARLQDDVKKAMSDRASAANAQQRLQDELSLLHARVGELERERAELAARLGEVRTDAFRRTSGSDAALEETRRTLAQVSADLERVTAAHRELVAAILVLDGQTPDTADLVQAGSEAEAVLSGMAAWHEEARTLLSSVDASGLASRLGDDLARLRALVEARDKDGAWIADQQRNIASLRAELEAAKGRIRAGDDTAILRQERDAGSAREQATAARLVATEARLRQADDARQAAEALVAQAVAARAAAQTQVTATERRMGDQVLEATAARDQTTREASSLRARIGGLESALAAADAARARAQSELAAAQKNDSSAAELARLSELLATAETKRADAERRTAMIDAQAMTVRETERAARTELERTLAYAEEAAQAAQERLAALHEQLSTKVPDVVADHAAPQLEPVALAHAPYARESALALVAGQALQRATDLPGAATTELAIAGSGERSLVGWRDPDGRCHLVEITNGHVKHHDLGADVPAAPGRPAVWRWPQEDSIHLVYRADDGHLHETFRLKGVWHRTCLTSQAGAPPAADAPMGFARGGNEWVLYRDVAGGIHELTFNGTAPWQHRPLLLGQPAAAGALAGGMHDDIALVAYRGHDGAIHLLRSRDRNWHHLRLDGPPAAGDPWPALGGELPGFIYLGHHGHLHLLKSDGFGWDCHDLAVMPGRVIG